MKPNFYDILYTPLDTAPMPNIDLDKMYQWLAESNKAQERFRKRINRYTSESNSPVPIYPWNISIAYYNMIGEGPGWLNNFDKEFPELVNYISTCFGIDLENFGSIVMLPMKDTTEGAGFYHQDHDWYGLRLYLEFEETDKNFLLIRGTKIPYDKQEMIDTPVDESLLQKKEHQAKILNNKQAWYVNNVRACHSTFVGAVGKRRIAVLLTSRFTNHDLVFPKIQELVMRSVDKYPDYTILWESEDAT